MNRNQILGVTSQGKLTKTSTHTNTKLLFGKATNAKNSATKNLKNTSRNSTAVPTHNISSQQHAPVRNAFQKTLETQCVTSNTLKTPYTDHAQNLRNSKQSLNTQALKTGNNANPTTIIKQQVQEIEKKQPIFEANNQQVLDSNYGAQNERVSSTEHQKDFLHKRGSIHSKRGRNQPSQQAYCIISQQQQSPATLNQQHQLLISNVNQQLQDVIIVNMAGRKDSCYGNDEDIYEVGHLNDVYLVNQVKLKEESSFSLNTSSLIKNDNLSNNYQIYKTSQQELFSIGSQSARNLVKQKAQYDLRIPLQEYNKILGPVEQEIDEGLSRLDASEFERLGLIKRRSLSFSSCDNISKYQGQTQSNIFKDHSKRPESSLLKSISSCHFIRKDSSHYDSPSERTILDVLGICSASGTFRMKRSSYQRFDKIVPHNMKNDFMNIDNEDGGPILLIHSQNQNEFRFSHMHDCTCSNQMIFNQYTGSENSFSTNKVVNNFLEEKKKELEALQEVDRESDTTEQMTYSQNSRAASVNSKEGGNTQKSSQKKRSKSKLQEYINEGGKKKKKGPKNWDELQRNSKQQMRSIRDLLENQHVDFASAKEDYKIDTSSEYILRTQPKVRTSRKMYVPILTQKLKHSSSAYCLFPTSSDVNRSKKSKFLSQTPKMKTSTTKHKQGAIKESNVYDCNNIMSFSNVQLKTLQTSKTANNLAAELSKSQIGQEIDLDNAERAKTPDDLSITELGGNIVMHLQKASVIKTFNFRPSKFEV